MAQLQSLRRGDRTARRDCVIGQPPQGHVRWAEREEVWRDTDEEDDLVGVCLTVIGIVRIGIRV